MSPDPMPSTPGGGPARPVCAAALSTEADLEAAVAEVAEEIESRLDGARPDLLFTFATHHFGGDLPRLSGELVAATNTENLVGCTGAWATGEGREEEHSPAVAVMAARLGDTRITVDHIAPPSEGGPETLDFEVEHPGSSGVFVFGDPFTFPATAWLSAFHDVNPGVPLVGGLAGGGIAPGQNILFAGSDAVNSGAVVCTIEGATRLVPAVSQGCRPVGPPLVATKVEGNVVLEFRGEPAAKVMFEVLESLDEADRRLFQAGAFIGRAVDAAKSKFTSGDFLVRNVMGLDPKRHAVAIADDGLRTGTTLQLMVRDATSASAELESMLEVAGLASAGEALGGLLFTCGGRGQGMFGRPHHDAAAIERAFGPGFPLAGFAAAGEIGPIGGRSFLHGFSASVALLAPRDS